MISYKIIVPVVVLVLLIGLFIYASRDTTVPQTPVVKQIDIAPIHP